MERKLPFLLLKKIQIKCLANVVKYEHRKEENTIHTHTQTSIQINSRIMRATECRSCILITSLQIGCLFLTVFKFVYGCGFNKFQNVRLYLTFLAFHKMVVYD